MTTNQDSIPRDAEAQEQNLNDKPSDESLGVDEEKALPPERNPDSEAPAPSEEKPPNPPSHNDGSGPPPNGGAKAWMQVLASYMLFFNTWGILK